MRTPLQILVIYRVIPAILGASFGAFIGHPGGPGSASNWAAGLAAVAVTMGASLELRLDAWYRSRVGEEMAGQRRLLADSLRRMVGTSEFDGEAGAALIRASEILEERS